MEKDEPVDNWSKEQLDAWALNITYYTVPQLHWHYKQVAMWAQKALGFSEKHANVLLEREITIPMILARKEEKSFFEDFDEDIKRKNIPKIALGALWDTIQKMKESLAKEVPLEELYFVMKAAAEPDDFKEFPDNVSQILIRTDDGDIVTVAQGVAKTTRSLVLKAYCPRTKQIICVKCTRGTSDSFTTEIDVIKQLNRAKVPNVPQLLFTGEVNWHGEQMQCFATDLFGESVASVLPLPLSEVQIMAQDILQALIGMHNLHLVHSDVKPSNIVRVWDSVLQRYKYSLIDFGFSFVEGTVSDGNWGCSVAYASQEILNGNAPTAKDDLKALWYTMIHALLGSLPWQYLGQSVELTMWAKEGWHDDFADVKNEQYAKLASLYNSMDVLPDPHQAWQDYLTDH